MKRSALQIVLFAAALQTATLVTPAPAGADPSVGAYLAGRQARFDYDFAQAAKYYSDALAKEPGNPVIEENVVASYMALGQMDRAIPVARRMLDAGGESQIAQMAVVAGLAHKHDYKAILAHLKDGTAMGEVADGIVIGWAELGQGDMKAALAQFDSVAGNKGLRAFALYHKALALAAAGDFEGADAVFAGKSDGPVRPTRRGVMAWAEVLSQLDRDKEAVAHIDDAFGGDPAPEIAALRARLAAGEKVPFAMIGGATDGIAETFYTLGRALMSQAGDDYVLLYARLAEYLRPDHVDAIMMTAQQLESLGRYDLAAAAYRRVPADDPAFAGAELGRAETLRKADKRDAAVEVLTSLSKAQPGMASVHVALGDLYRGMEQFSKAVAAYDKAAEIFAAHDNPQWFVFYTRGIAYERLGEWPKAEADFRHALKLNPDQPQVLNYLGYSMVEKHEKLDEALSFIRQAVAAQPDSGYVVDSLGWALYRLGRYSEAIDHMEHAAELMATDPVVNDHLGDVLWAVGRKAEARFQWRRALSLIDRGNTAEDMNPDRIRRKLEVGLDKVLAEEGSPPLKVANGKN